MTKLFEIEKLTEKNDRDQTLQACKPNSCNPYACNPIRGGCNPADHVDNKSDTNDESTMRP